VRCAPVTHELHHPRLQEEGGCGHCLERCELALSGPSNPAAVWPSDMRLAARVSRLLGRRAHLRLHYRLVVLADGPEPHVHR